MNGYINHHLSYENMYLCIRCSISLPKYSIELGVNVSDKINNNLNVEEFRNILFNKPNLTCVTMRIYSRIQVCSNLGNL